MIVNFVLSPIVEKKHEIRKVQKDELDLSDDEEHDQDLIQFKKKELVVEDVKDKLQTNHEQIYIFCLLWSMGAFLENNDRMKFESYLNKHTKLKMPKIPDGDSIFNYNVDVHTGEWSHWNNLIQVSTLSFLIVGGKYLKLIIF